MKYVCIILRKCRQLLRQTPAGELPLGHAGGLPSFRPPNYPTLEKILRQLGSGGWKRIGNYKGSTANQSLPILINIHRYRCGQMHVKIRYFQFHLYDSSHAMAILEPAVDLVSASPSDV